METTVEAMRKTMKDAVPVRVSDPQYRPRNFPDKFLVTGITPYAGDRYFVYGYNPETGGADSIVVSGTSELVRLTGVEKKELLETWEIAQIGIKGDRLSCTLGADPEIFAVDSKGYAVPAWTYLPSKSEPLYFRLANNGGSSGTAYWDGFQAEFTTKADIECLSWLGDNVYIGLKTIHDAASKVGAKLTIDSVLPVDTEVLATAENQYVEFGCAPSFNAYGLKGNVRSGRTTPYRFAGGHLHFGLYGAKSEERIERYVKALDLVLGVASVSLLGELDNPIRRKHYGLPGEYRTPRHGFEYRVLSNAWLCHPLAMNIVFDLARSVCGLADKKMLELWDCKEKEMLQILIENDVKKARKVLARNEQVFKQILRVIGGTGYYNDAEGRDAAYKVWAGGIDVAVKDPKDVVGNWNLDGDWITHCDGTGKNWAKAHALIKAGEKV